MKITDVRVRKITDEGKMKCIVSLTFENLFVVHDIKVIEGHNGLFIAMPSRKVGEGKKRGFLTFTVRKKCSFFPTLSFEGITEKV